MLFRYRIGIFKPCLTQNCLSSILITIKPSFQINFCSTALIVSLENKLCDMLKDLLHFLMTCFTHKKNLVYSAVWPSLFWSFHWSKTNTKHKWTIKLTFKLGTMKIKWLSTQWWGNLQNCNLFPSSETMKSTDQIHIFMIVLFEVTTLSAQVNKFMKASITEHERGVCLDANGKHPRQTCFVGPLMWLLLF